MPRRSRSTTVETPNPESIGPKRTKRKPSDIDSNDHDTGRPKQKRQRKDTISQPKISHAAKQLAKSKLKNSPQTRERVKSRAGPRTTQRKSKPKHDSLDQPKRAVRSPSKLKVKNEPGTMTSGMIRKRVIGKHNKFVGAHTSIAGGLYKAVLEATEMGAQAFGMFLKSQRQWASKPLEDKDAEKFKQTCQEHGFAPHLILPHGSYLMNCGSPHSENLQKSRNALVDELKRCEKLGLTLFNFHPGSTLGEISVEECLKRIADSINLAHSKTKYCIAVVENMCCQGNTVGGKFSELRGIIDKVHDKSRVGVCLDTCHAFAAGYDLSTENGFHKMMEEFESVVGLEYLKALHMNDSKGKIACHLDRHENIGRGQIGIEGFRRIMNDHRFNNIPFVLETPQGDYTTGYEKEIRKLYSLCKS